MLLEQLTIETDDVLKKLSDNVEQKYLVILIGIPLSGKSTFVKKIKNIRNDVLVASTDDLFMFDGEYRYDLSKREENHQKNYEKAKLAIRHGVKTVVIDNTNIGVWQFKKYIDYGLVNGYKVLFKMFEIDRETAIERDLKRQNEIKGKFMGEKVIDGMIANFNKNKKKMLNFINRYNSGKYQKKYIYIGIFINKNKLISILPENVNMNINNPHVTLLFNNENKDADIEKELKKLIGKHVNVIINKMIYNDKIKTLLVDIGNVPIDTVSKPHVTLETNGVKPFHSNKLILDGNYKEIKINNVVDGIIDYFPR